jgi:hypothetical protein
MILDFVVVIWMQHSLIPYPDSLIKQRREVLCWHNDEHFIVHLARYRY